MLTPRRYASATGRHSELSELTCHILVEATYRLQPYSVLVCMYVYVPTATEATRRLKQAVG